jgi:hypothetical protein
MAARSISVMAAVLVTVGAGPAHAGQDDPAGLRTMVVRTYNGFGVPGRDLARAESTAGDIFADIGIRAVWIECGSGRHPQTATPSVCGKPVTPAEVLLRMGAAGRLDAPSLMGSALVTSRAGAPSMLATVFVDRVLDVARAAGVDPRVLIGRVIAHEIGHVLLSNDAHATSGLMRANWLQAELRGTRPGDWHFLSSEARVIRDEVTSRTGGGRRSRVECLADLGDHTCL